MSVQWTETSSGAKASIGGGAISMSISWATTGYAVYVGAKELAFRPQNLATAKGAAESRAREIVQKCARDLGEESAR